MSSVEPDVILHLAALADVDACEASPNEAYRCNVVTARNVAAVSALRHRAPKMILISTDQVYDSPRPNPVGNPRPSNTYALTKLWSEETATLHLPDTVVLRTNFLCLGESRRLGFGGWLMHSLAANERLQLFCDVFFNPLHASHFPDLINKFANTTMGGTYNLGAHGNGMSKAELGYELARRAGLEVTQVEEILVGNAGLNAYRPREMVMDVSETEAFLGAMLPTLDQCIDALVQEWMESEMGRPS